MARENGPIVVLGSDTKIAIDPMGTTYWPGQSDLSKDPRSVTALELPPEEWCTVFAYQDRPSPN